MTKVSFRGECGKYVCVPTSGVLPLSWRFLVGLVLDSESSGILSSLVWVKSIVGRTMELIYSSDSSCIISSLLMCTTRSDILDDLVGKLLVDSTYSESPSLPPKLAADVISLSGFMGGLGDAF